MKAVQLIGHVILLFAGQYMQTQLQKSQKNKHLRPLYKPHSKMLLPWAFESDLTGCYSNKWHPLWRWYSQISTAFPPASQQWANSELHWVTMNQVPGDCRLGVDCHPSTNPPHFASKQDRWLLSLSSRGRNVPLDYSLCAKPFSPSSSLLSCLFSSVVGSVFCIRPTAADWSNYLR